MNTPEARSGDGWLEDALDRHDEQTNLAIAFCTAPTMRRQRSKSLAATFRCRRRGCVLAYVYRTPRGVIVHQPVYKLSPRLNAKNSNESGRANNTTDGDRKWKPQIFFLQRNNQHQLNCDHVRHVVTATEIEDAATRGSGTVIV